MEFRYSIDDLPVDQPNGLSEIVMGLVRDPEGSHGMMYQASTSVLVFSGAGANYLMSVEKSLGLKADVIFLAEFRCDDTQEFEEMIKGKLNFGNYKRACGSECSVAITVEQSNYTMIFRNRLDQKVDMDSLTAFDGFTAVEKYARMGFALEYPAKEIPVGAKGSVVNDKDRVLLNIFTPGSGAKYYIRPTYGVSENESLIQTQLKPSVNAASNNGFNDSVLSPIVLNDESVNCFSGNLEYNKIRIKGTHHLVGSGLSASIDLYKGSLGSGGVFPSALTLLGTQAIPVSPSDPPVFDKTFSGSVTLKSGEGLWAMFTINSGTIDTEFSYVEFDKETSVDITSVRSCPRTAAKVYALHESLSHIVESVTNGCLRVRSDYYGRADSQPYSAGSDGCGGMRVINCGLQLRNGKQSDGSDAKLFLSFKDMMAGLNPIDNIGYGIESDPLRPGFDLLRIESVEYFYKDEEILSLPNAVGVIEEVDEGKHYSSIKIGYEKWEVENVNGLDEINSNKEYRTSLNSVSNPLNLLSKFIGGSFAHEITRQQTFAETGGADTKYDNETFITCVKRNDLQWQVEQGGIANPQNMFSPSTVYNWKIRPFYNLMRWFKSIASSYANITDSDNNLFFTSGTANLLASGEQVDESCKLENGPKAENADLRPSDFKEIEKCYPLWRPKPITVKYPLSIKEFKKLKANPYGYISVQCGTGEFLKGFIDDLKFIPIKGEATFILRQKW